MDRFFIELVLTLGTKNIIENCRRRKKSRICEKSRHPPNVFSFHLLSNKAIWSHYWIDMDDY